MTQVIPVSMGDEAAKPQPGRPRVRAVKVAQLQIVNLPETQGARAGRVASVGVSPAAQRRIATQQQWRFDVPQAGNLA